MKTILSLLSLDKLCAWLGSAMSEANGKPSSTRLTSTVGSLMVIATVCALSIIIVVRSPALSDLPLTLAGFLTGLLTLLLGARAHQDRLKERRPPATPTPPA